MVCCVLYCITLCSVSFVCEHTIRSGVLTSPGLMTSDDGSSHLDLQLFIACLCKRAKFSQVLWRSVFCSSADTMRSFSAVFVFSSAERPGGDCGLKRPEFEVLYDCLLRFFLSCVYNFLGTRNVSIFFWCCHLISAKINFRGPGYPLLLPLYFSFKKLPVIFNQWVIHYWGCAGWQDARPVLFARWISCSQDAHHIII